MNFKTKKDLIDEKYGIQINTNNWEQEEVIESGGFGEGIDYAFNSFKERINFYEKYSKYGIEMFRLRDVDWDLYMDFLVYNKKHNYTNGSSSVHDTYYFMKWLFNYCFGDIE